MRDLQKRSMLSAPLNWESIVKVCNKVGSLMFCFANKDYIVGLFQLESMKLVSENTSTVDPESGFFMMQRPKGTLQFYKSNSHYVTYNGKKKCL